MGDVAGQDLSAATAIGRLRNMLRALVYNRGPRVAPPCDVLCQLDAVADGLAVAPFTSAVHTHLVYGPDDWWRAHWSNAGQPPLRVAPSLPRTSHHQNLGPGDIMLLYTDRLIGTPAGSLTDGQRQLVDIAARYRHLPLPELLRHLQGLSDHRNDTAMIAFRAAPWLTWSASAPSPRLAFARVRSAALRYGSGEAPGPRARYPTVRRDRRRRSVPGPAA
ncbi:PP2C family protein-serine/threonine phosphatase [Kitasatospora cineracea]|uniref:PP2C family protein-serine/threonine phosphatase n=1 Tax=Kitasatospora cineracea TaxID=88074 RepID=UPI0038133D3D